MNKDWFKAAGIRAIKTMAEAAIAMIGTGALMSDIDWVKVASASVLSGILSLLWSIKGIPEVDLQNNDYKNVCNQQSIRQNNGEFDNVDYTEDVEKTPEIEEDL